MTWIQGELTKSNVDQLIKELVMITVKIKTEAFLEEELNEHKRLVVNDTNREK